MKAPTRAYTILRLLTVGYKPLCGPSFEALLYIHTIYNITPTCCCVMCKVYLLLFTTWDLGNILTSYFLASTTSRSGARSQMLLIDAVSLCKHAAAAYKPRVQIKFEMKNSSASSIKANCQCWLCCCVIVVLFYYNKTNVKMSNCLWTQH